ncbi:MAG: methyltransferase domain-containing protein [Saprospiraceae bacterium]|nr:methyltransferase domain-containing protein [Saprospiraceae bacterium]
MDDEKQFTLQQNLKRRYDIEEFSLSIGQLSLKWLRIQNTDQLFDELLAKDADDPDLEDERMPYWADLWPSALALSQYLLRHQDLISGKTTLEIGCGLGLCGMVAADIGARVTLSDYLPEPLEVVRYLWWLNRQEEPDLLQMDWRYPPQNLQFDLLLASDISYEIRAHEPLVGAIRKLLKPGGRVLLSEPRRSTANAFFKLLAREGFLYERQEELVRLSGQLVTVDVYDIRI